MPKHQKTVQALTRKRQPKRKPKWWLKDGCKRGSDHPEHPDALTRMPLDAFLLLLLFLNAGDLWALMRTAKFYGERGRTGPAWYRLAPSDFRPTKKFFDVYRYVNNKHNNGQPTMPWCRHGETRLMSKKGGGTGICACPRVQWGHPVFHLFSDQGYEVGRFVQRGPPRTFFHIHPDVLARIRVALDAQGLRIPGCGLDLYGLPLSTYTQCVFDLPYPLPNWDASYRQFQGEVEALAKAMDAKALCLPGTEGGHLPFVLHWLASILAEWLLWPVRSLGQDEDERRMAVDLCGMIGYTSLNWVLFLSRLANDGDLSDCALPTGHALLGAHPNQSAAAAASAFPRMHHQDFATYVEQTVMPLLVDAFLKAVLSKVDDSARFLQDVRHGRPNASFLVDLGQKLQNRRRCIVRRLQDLIKKGLDGIRPGLQISHL